MIIVSQDLSEQLSFVRISEILDDNCVVSGNFNDQHLKNLHAYIFQDSLEHKPGITRSNTKDIWYKDRELEPTFDKQGNLITYPKHPVAYANKNIDKLLSQALTNNNIDKLSTLSVEDFAQKITDLYSNLDYIHSFHEGNSRTLRTFTYLMAKQAGFLFDWNTTNVTAESRNQLYNARDLAVYNHFYKGLLSDEYTKNHKFNNQIEYFIAMRSNAFKKQQEQLNQQDLYSIVLHSLTKIEPQLVCSNEQTVKIKI